MIANMVVHMRIEEVCVAAGISIRALIEIVDYGIVEPEGVSRRDWRFDPQAIAVIKRAARLKQDLDIDWGGVALALDLLAEIDELRGENRMLRQRLRRFLL